MASLNVLVAEDEQFAGIHMSVGKVKCLNVTCGLKKVSAKP